MNPHGSRPPWDFSKLQQVNIPAVDPYYEFSFFKYM